MLTTDFQLVKSDPVAGAMSAPIHVLAIDDDPSVRQMIADYLGDNEIQVTALASGQAIADVMARHTIDLLILDLKMPGEDGLQIARNLRVESDIPIIILTGRKEEADRVMGLELGADDYLTKPFSPRELLARIRALLRRSRTHETVADGLARIRAYRFAGWELNVRLRRLMSPQSETIPITNSEFNLLVAFLAAPRRVLSREQLLDSSRLHNDEVFDRSVDVQVGRLRRKIEPKGSRTALIRTEPGAGHHRNPQPGHRAARASGVCRRRAGQEGGRALCHRSATLPSPTRAGQGEPGSSRSEPGQRQAESGAELPADRAKGSQPAGLRHGSRAGAFQCRTGGSPEGSSAQRGAEPGIRDTPRIARRLHEQLAGQAGLADHRPAVASHDVVLERPDVGEFQHQRGQAAGAAEDTETPARRPARYGTAISYPACRRHRLPASRQAQLRR